MLIIAYSFPPDGEVGAKRVARLCRYLPEFGISPVVLTVEKRFNTINDETFPVPENIRVVRTRCLTNPLDWYRRSKTHRKPLPRLPPQPSLKSQNRSHGLRRQIVSLLEIPDHYWGWYFPAIRAAEALIEQERIAVVFSSGPPWTSHLVARHLKKKYRIPWIADFRDAWLSDVWRDVPRWRERIDGGLEASCVKWADLVLCVTDGIQTQFTERYPAIPAAKFITLTNGFDGSIPSAPRMAPRGSQLLCLHLGELYAGRRIDTFCKALVELIRTGRLDPTGVRVVFLGSCDAAIVASAHRVAPELIENNCVEFRPRVTWAEGQQFLDSADVLLIFQGNHRGVTAKFYEYLQTGKPIFAIAKQGDLTEMLNTTGSGISADPEDPADIASKFLAALKLPVRSPEEVQRLAQIYHFRSLSHRLAVMIRGVGGESSRSKNTGINATW